MEAVLDASISAVPNVPTVRDIESERRSAARADQGDFVTVVHACEHVAHKLGGERLLARTLTNVEAARACR